MKYPFCTNCKKTVRYYGLPYGLEIGSSSEGEGTDMHRVIMIQCAECGAVVGAYKTEEK